MANTRISYYLFILGTVIFCFAGCIIKSNGEKRHCGIVMKPDEVVRVENKQKNYRYSDNDMNLHGEIAYLAQQIGGENVIVEVFFFLSNEKELGIYLNGPNDDKIIEAMTCAIINGKYEAHAPPNKYILYYNDSTNKLISAIKTPKGSKSN